MLLISLVVLALAPGFYYVAQRLQNSWSLVDRLLSVLVTSLVVVHILPESILMGGYVCALFALFGLVLPSLLERLWKRVAPHIHGFSLMLAVSGLLVHGALDGAALAAPTAISSLPFAVLMHRLPVGVFIWSVFARKNLAAPICLLAALGLATVLGFLSSGHAMRQAFDPQYLAYFQALISGSLLHHGFDWHD